MAISDAGARNQKRGLKKGASKLKDLDEKGDKKVRGGGFVFTSTNNGSTPTLQK